MPRCLTQQSDRSSSFAQLTEVQERISALMAIGRGWKIYEYPISLEPVSQAHSENNGTEICVQPRFTDDGRYPGPLEKLFSGNRTSLPRPRQAQTISPHLTPIAPQEISPFKISELQVSLPQTSVVTPQLTERLLLSLANRTVTSSLEILSSDKEIVVQAAVRECDAVQAETQIKAHFPESTVSKVDNYLKNLFQIENHSLSDCDYPLVINFGLRREAVYSLQTLRSFEPDPLIGLITGLADLRQGERCVFQVLFQSIHERWSDRFVSGLMDENGNPRFQESKDLLTQVRQKFSHPVLAVAIRLGVIASSRERAVQIARGLAGAIHSFGSPTGNELIALRNTAIPAVDQITSLVNRISYHEGMLLNISELASLTHLPSASVENHKLRREELKTKMSPNAAAENTLVLGDNYHKGNIRQVSLSNEQRTRHIHLIGSSGSGKSTLMLNLIRQDMKQNQGLCVIDPHGDLIDEVIANVPNERIDDVVLFDPSDSEHPVGFNILQANTELEKTILSSDLTATFRRMSTSWGDVMDSVLANAVLAIIESTRSGTLLDLKRFLVEKPFRNEFLESVTDDAIRYYWHHEFPLLASKPQASILIRLDTFLRQKLIRNIVCQGKTKLNFREIMDQQKVLLIKLSQGLIGSENAYLLGTLLVSKLYQTALTRQDADVRPNFWLYLDEFHHFITPSMEGILSGARKYHLGLTLAHQEFRQLQSRNQEVASSVLSNCYTRICFRLGDTDAEKLASGFSFFDAKSLQNLGVGEAIGRIERAEYDFNLETSLLPPIDPEVAEQRRSEIIRQTREKYGRPKVDVELEFQRTRCTATIPMPSSASESPKKKVASRPVIGIDSVTQQPLGQSPAPLARQNEVSSAVDASLFTKQGADKRTQQHKYLQSLVKRMAENKGFRTTLEKEVFGGVGRIDVALENEIHRIACEISVSNEADYEVQNIRKCISAGYSPVIMISADTRHLVKIREKAQANLPDDDFAITEYFTPEDLFSWLDGMDSTGPENTERVKGFKINVRLKSVNRAEQSSHKQAISDVVFGALRRLKKKDNDK